MNKIDVEEMVNDALEVAKATGIPLEELIANYPDWLKARITLAPLSLLLLQKERLTLSKGVTVFSLYSTFISL
jgi:hypothetical protein